VTPDPDWKQVNENLTTDIKIVIAIVLLAIATICGVVTVQILANDETQSKTGLGDTVLRADSHRLDIAKDGKVTLVEFLDFECEACGAAYPSIEQLRKTYEGRVTFVARYFPLPGHRNSRNAAHAVESAARQGKFEQMYQRMFETQAEWGESQASKAQLFRTYAEELGLDMEEYDRDVDSSTVAKRVEADFADGQEAGVSGTPTFFLNGERVESSSVADLTEAIETALAQ